MKKLLAIIVAIVAVSSSLVSCLGSDNNEESKFYYLTNADRTAIMSKTAGSYKGYTKYYKSYLKIDSVPSAHTVLSDTTVMIDFPVKLLADYVTMPTDSMAKKELKEARPVLLKFKAYLPYVLTSDLWTYWQNNDLADFAMVPVEKEITFNTENHTFKLYLTNESVIYGNIQYANMLEYVKKMSQGYVNLQKLEIDKTSSYKLNVPTCFFGNKQ